MIHRNWWCLSILLSVAVHAQDNFQQEVGYSIDVTLDDVKHSLDGHIAIRYANRSPDVLDTIWLHLWPNAYKDKFTSLCKQHVSMGQFDLQFAKEEERGRISIAHLKADTSMARWGYHTKWPDVAWVKLENPLDHGQEVTLECDFLVELPSGRFSRLGHIGQSYQITQWFPKPAVYNADGWNIMPYLTQGEFFSEFASFDVRITLPSNYVVGATGELQNDEEVTWLDSLASLPLDPDKNNEFPASSNTLKTLRYVQGHVHDFAWFADKRYHVRKGQVKLPRSKRDVDTWTMFTPENAKIWENAIQFVNESVMTYSSWVGDYPYSHVTAVDGTISAGGGMEYPMITVIGNASSSFELDIVISHEVGHNWFYGILASNERAHPWMDEGLNSFLEMVHIGGRYPNIRDAGLGIEFAFAEGAPEVQQGYRYRNEIAYLFQARKGKDQPPNGHSESFTPTNYGLMVYSKTALVFDMLLAYLGAETFIKCLTSYYDTWSFSHPGPDDIRHVFEQVSGEDLGWCFDGFMGTDRKFDPRAIHLENGELQYAVKGGIPAPFPITAWAGEQVLGTTWIRPDGASGRATLPWRNADRVRIDAPQRTLDVDRTNNEVRESGVFKQLAPISLKFLFGTDRADREQFLWSPMLGANAADGLMPGLFLTNTGLPSKQTEIVLAPLYGVNSGNLSGAFRLAQHFDRSTSWTRGLHLTLNGRRSGLIENDDLQAAYSKLSFGIDQEIMPNRVKKSVFSRIAYRTIWIEEQSTLESESDRFEISTEEIFHELSFEVKRSKGLNPFKGELNLLYNEQGFLRGHADLTFETVLNEKEDRLSLRLFAGKFFDLQQADPRAAFTTAGQNGQEDLLYDGLFSGRYERAGVWPQQFMKNMGGFKTPTALGVSDDHILSLNLEMDLPFNLPLAVFASTARVPEKRVDQSGVSIENQYYNEAGMGLRLFRNIFEIWVPMIYSERIEDEFEFTDTPFHERIRFTLDLSKIDPTRLVRRISP